VKVACFGPLLISGSGLLRLLRTRAAPLPV